MTQQQVADSCVRDEVERDALEPRVDRDEGLEAVDRVDAGGDRVVGAREAALGLDGQETDPSRISSSSCWSSTPLRRSASVSCA